MILNLLKICIFLFNERQQKKLQDKNQLKIGGKLAIKIALFFESEILFDVPPEAFDIKPKVTSSFIRLIKKDGLDYDISLKENLFKIIDLAFSSRSKNIKNNLQKIGIDWQKINVDPRKRPEVISIEEYINISKEYNL